MRRATDLHRVALEFNSLRAVDVIALVTGYCLLMWIATLGVVTLVDWMNGLPPFGWLDTIKEALR